MGGAFSYCLCVVLAPNLLTINSHLFLKQYREVIKQTSELGTRESMDGGYDVLGSGDLVSIPWNLEPCHPHSSSRSLSRPSPGTHDLCLSTFH